MTPPHQQALLALLDDQDAEVWAQVRAQILQDGVDFLPLLLQERQQNPSPVVQQRVADLLPRLHYPQLRQDLRHWRDHQSDDLLAGMALLAAYQDPGIKLHALRQEIDTLYAKAWVGLGANRNPTEKVKLLNGAFFDGLGFKPTAPEAFEDIDNSRIDQVLERRTGNPISLCVVYMLIARKMRMPIYGVNMPNVFVLVYDAPDLRFYINVFNRGSIFTRHEIDAYLSRLGITPRPPYYEPCSHPAILRRVLRNMTVSYQNAAATQSMADMQALLELLSQEG